jgi:protein subunit release factor A
MQLGIVPQGIMITHVPTGLIAISDAERNQYKNKKVAMDEIIKKLKSL